MCRIALFVFATVRHRMLGKGTGADPAHYTYIDDESFSATSWDNGPLGFRATPKIL